MFPKNNLKMIFATLLGNIFEFYDFIIFGFMLKYIQNIFLPDYLTTSKYILSFLLFSIGYLGRPVGAYLLGKIGDRQGRRISIASSIILLTISTCLIGLLPTYQQIGIAAPILLIILRLIQNFSVSVEQVGGALFLIESLPKNKGYWVSSLIFGTVYLGHVIGLALMLVLVNTLNENQIIAWGWRVPFLLALPIGCVTAYLRLRLSESEQFVIYKNRTVTKNKFLNKRDVISVLGSFLALSGSAYLTMIYIPNMLNFHDILSVQQIFKITILISLVIFVTAMICGVVAEKGMINGLRLQNTALLGSILFAVPMYMLLNSGTAASILLAHLFSAILLGMQAGTIFGTIFDCYDFANRYTVINLGFNLAMTFFGGLTPFVVAYLSETVHVLSPAVYLMVLSSVSLVFINWRFLDKLGMTNNCHPERSEGSRVSI